MRSRRPSFRVALVTACLLALAGSGCLPDKPLEDPTPVGARPGPTGVAVASPGASVSGSPVASGGPAPAAPTAASAAGALAGKIGEPTKSGDVVMTINTAQRTDQLLILNITTENTGQDDVFVQPAVDFLVQYGPENDRTTAPPVTFGVPQPRYNGDVKKGQKSTGNVAFQVPQSAQNVVVNWRPQSQGGRVVATWPIAGA